MPPWLPRICGREVSREKHRTHLCVEPHSVCFLCCEVGLLPRCLGDSQLAIPNTQCRQEFTIAITVTTQHTHTHTVSPFGSTLIDTHALMDRSRNTSLLSSVCTRSVTSKPSNVTLTPARAHTHVDHTATMTTRVSPVSEQEECLQRVSGAYRCGRSDSSGRRDGRVTLCRQRLRC